MHTPRMNYRQSISLNEAVMEAMMGKKPMQADLEKMSGDDRKTLRKHLTAYKNNQKELEKIVVQAAVEDGRMKAEDIEEETGAMGGRGGGAAPPAGGAAPPAGGAARMGGFFGGGSKPTGTRPGKGPDISKKQKKKKKRPLKLPKVPPWLKDPKLLPFDVDPGFLDKVFKKITEGLSDLTGIEENDTVNKYLKKYLWNRIPGLLEIEDLLSDLDKIDTDRKKKGEDEGEGEAGGNQPG